MLIHAARLALVGMLMLLAVGVAVAEEPPYREIRPREGGLARLHFSLSGQAPPGAGAAEAAYTLTLREAVVLALKNNLDITVEGFNPRIRETDIAREKAVFDPVFSADTTVSRSRVQNNAAVFIPGSLLTTDTRTWNVNFKLTDKLPTGASTEVSWTNQRLRTNSISTVFNPAYTTGLTAKITQPLLKNFGIDINQTQIKLATNNREIAKSNLKTKIFDVVTNTLLAYFDLLSGIENLAVQRRSLALAQELVALNRARVRAGVAAPVEVTQAEAQAAAREQDVFVAEKAVKDREDNLRLILNLPAGSIGWDGALVPTDRPTLPLPAADLQENIRTALAKRGDYEAAKIDIANRELNRRLQRNQLLPDLSIVGSAGLTGLDGTTRNRGGSIVDLGGEANSLRDMASGAYNNWSAGLTLTMPLGNRAAEATFTRAVLEEEQSRASLRKLELLITLEVREAARRIETDAKRVESTRVARRLAEEQLRIEQQRLRAGVTTTFNVLQFQRDLTVAQAAEVQALNDFQKSLANMEKVRGTILERFEIQL